MKCQICGAEMKEVRTDLPFKVSDTTIVIMKGLPVIQCKSCSEYLIKDEVMERIDEMIEKVDASAELEVISYAA